MVMPSGGVPHKVVTPREMECTSALNRAKAILDKAFPSYLMIAGDQAVPFGAGCDRPGIWPQVMANILAQNPALRHAVIVACLEADRQGMELRTALQGKIQEQIAKGENDTHGVIQQP